MMTYAAAANISPGQVRELYEQVIEGRDLSTEEGLAEASRLWQAAPEVVMEYASKLRTHFKATSLKLCGIVNARSGKCSEDCHFCAQSRFYLQPNIPVYPLQDLAAIEAALTSLLPAKIHCFSLVTSGKALGRREVESVAKIIEALRVKYPELILSASLGILDAEKLTILKDAGLQRYHHNLETAPSYFPKICTTHDYMSRVATILAAEEVGLEVCAGGIIGLGESLEERLVLAATLKRLAVQLVPLNFLVPLAGTPLAKAPPLSPLEIFQTIAIMRFILPTAEILICGGREAHLQEQQSRIFAAGASGMMVGNYLTQQGRQLTDDLEMLQELGLEW